MKPKEKAIEIANKFTRKSVFEMDNDELKVEREEAKKQALICLEYLKEEGSNYIKYTSYNMTRMKYWIEVENEIKLL